MVSALAGLHVFNVLNGQVLRGIAGDFVELVSFHYSDHTNPMRSAN